MGNRRDRNVQQKKPIAWSLVRYLPCTVAVGYVPVSIGRKRYQQIMAYYPSMIVDFFAEGTNVKDYSEIGKKATDVLYSDFGTGVNVCIKSYPFASNVTSGGEDQLIPFTSLQVKHKSIRCLTADLKFNFDRTLRIESTVDPIARGLSCLVNVVVPDQNTSNVVLKYKHEYFSVRTSIGLFRNPLLGLSAVLGTSAITIGADVAMDVSTMNFRRLDGCASFTSDDSTGSLMIRDSGDNVTASLYHTRANAAIGVEMSRLRAANINTLSVGVQHFFGEATIKSRVDSTGSWAGVVQYNWSPHTFLRATAAIPHDQDPRFGFSFASGS